MSRSTLLWLTAAALIGCSGPQVDRRAEEAVDLPPMPAFPRAAVEPVPAGLGNDMIARDILDLVFRIETGDEIARLMRFDAPITVALAPGAPRHLQNDLDRLLARLRGEAGLDIARHRGRGPATITVELVSKSQIDAASPGSACFVRPNVTSWREFRRAGGAETDWARMTRRTSAAVFLPDDASPQEMRNCLHEELAQALGPVNDAYRLTYSTFSDDPFRQMLTGFDLLVLRAIYDPRLSEGMSRAQVAERLPAILNDLRPEGRAAGVAPPVAEPAVWAEAIRKATAVGVTPAARIAAAERAVGLSRAWGDARHAFSLYMLGRATLESQPRRALNALTAAGRYYESRPGFAIHQAYVAMPTAGLQLSAGRPEIAEALVDRHLPAAIAAEDARLAALLLMIRAEAQRALGKSVAAEASKSEAIAWGRYGFGSAEEIAARLAEIAAIRPGRPT